MLRPVNPWLMVVALGVEWGFTPCKSMAYGGSVGG